MTEAPRNEQRVDLCCFDSDRQLPVVLEGEDFSPRCGRVTPGHAMIALGVEEKSTQIMGRRLMRLPLRRDFHFSGPAIGFAFCYLLDDAVGSWPPSSRRWRPRANGIVQ